MDMNIKSIEFQDNTAVVTMLSPERLNEVERKRVSIEALISSLGKISTYRSMIIPPNCRGIWETKTSTYFLFIIPGHMGKVVAEWYHRDTELYGRPGEDTKLSSQDEHIQTMYAEQEDNGIRVFDVPFPNACVLLKMTKTGKGFTFNTMRAWAIKSTMFPLDKTPLYRWPYFNMYNDARVCVGDIPTSYPNVDSVSSILNYLYIGVGNSDLSSTDYVRCEDTWQLHDSWEAIKKFHEAEIKEFPNTVLVNFSTSMLETIENIVANND